MDAATTRYIERDGAALAFQVIGNGAGDALIAGEIGGHLDLLWSDPHFHALLERASSHARVIVTQRRGIGLSDPIGYMPTIEQQADDLLAILDAVGSRSATLVGAYTTCAAAALVAARNPERVRNLLLLQPFAAGALSDSALEAGWDLDESPQIVDQLRAVCEEWGTGLSLDIWDRSLVSSYNRRLMAMLERCSAGRATARENMEWAVQSSFTEIYKTVPVPTAAVYIPGNIVPLQVVQTVADMVDGARLIQLEPNPPGAALGEGFLPTFDLLIEMVTGAAAPEDLGRFLGTVLLTDVVSSTELLAHVGDARYRELRDAHEHQVRHQVESHGGRLVSVSGDGTFSLFDGPTRAVRAAEVICRAASDVGITVRAGVHTGELEHTPAHDLTGMTVHIGARVMASAEPGEVLVSRTVHDLAMGSGLHFRSKGEQALKGVPGSWELFALSAATDAPTTAIDPLPATAMDRVALHLAQRRPRLARGAVAAGNAWQRRRAKTG